MAIEIIADRLPNYLGLGIEIRFIDQQTREVGTELIMSKMNDGEMASSLLVLRPTQAQTLIDELWNCGVRPTEGVGSAGSLAATERHLSDLRTLYFHKMGIML